MGSGKTLGEVNCAIDMGMDCPGLQCYIGAYDITMARRNTIQYFEEAFRSPETGKLWKHPACQQGFGTKTNIMSLYNGSKYTYLNLKDAIEKNVGFSSGILCIEEPHTLPDENGFMTLISRARAKPPDVNQIILCTNPSRSVDSWINNVFELEVFKGVDTSKGPVEKLVGKPCTCHLCVVCGAHGKEIGFKQRRDGHWECPDCGAVKDFWLWEGERIYCPGGEKWMRVVKSETGHNKHLSQSYMQSMMDVYDAKTVAVFVHGATDLNLEDDQVFHKFNKEAHILPENEEINWDEDIIWGIDFNLKPNCSSISQLEKIVGEQCLIVKDEIIMYGPTMEDQYTKASAEDVAREFVRRYKDHYKGTLIRMFGDPKGFDGQTSRELTKYDKVIKILNESGFLTSLEADREQISVKECVDVVNEVLVKNRLLINPKCVHVIASLSNLKWKEKTEATMTPIMDKSGDHNAARSNNRSRIYTMTHPTDGLRYALWKLMPMLGGLGRRSATFGNRVIEELEDGTTTITYEDAPNSTKKLYEAPQGALDSEYDRMFNDIGRVVEQIENQPFRSLLNGLGIRLPPPIEKKNS